MNFPPTVILRHQREKLKKCSLRGLEPRPDMHFLRYPCAALPVLTQYIMLSFDGPLISPRDAHQGLFIIDATWRYAEVMGHYVNEQLPDMEKRSLPATLRTAYPRKQEDCANPERGLASVEALYAAYYLMGRSLDGLLDSYYWREQFIELNPMLND